MNKKLLRPALFVMTILCSFHSFANLETRYENDQDSYLKYRCMDRKQIYMRDDISNVGVGLVDKGGQEKMITFCFDKTANSCYMAEHTIDSPQGQLDYITLLGATMSGGTVQFYCNASGWAENIHFIKNKK